MNRKLIIQMGAAVVAATLACGVMAAEPPDVLTRSKKAVPAPPWPSGEEMGMANAIGPGTWSRCAWHMADAGAKGYELSHVRSNTMPKSPFSGPYMQKFKPTGGIPGTAHAFNGEQLEAGAEPGAQGTQMDAIGHFATMKEPWDGKAPFPMDKVIYYGGFSQEQVKPTTDSPLMKLGIEKIPPIITTAVLLDAKTVVGGGKSMKAGDVVNVEHIQAMLKAQGLSERGILPGDVVYIYTGWGDNWSDPDNEKVYYSMGPGLAYDAALYLAKQRIVALGLDTPFIDPVAAGMLQGKAGPAPGTPPGLPFAVHHHLLSQAGIHHLESMNLGALAADKVWTSCTMVLPIREQGAAGSPIRPVAIGRPNQ